MYEHNPDDFLAQVPYETKVELLFGPWNEIVNMFKGPTWDENIRILCNLE